MIERANTTIWQAMSELDERVEAAFRRGDVITAYQDARTLLSLKEYYLSPATQSGMDRIMLMGVDDD